jgi:hypothetical protein
MPLQEITTSTTTTIHKSSSVLLRWIRLGAVKSGRFGASVIVGADELAPSSCQQSVCYLVVHWAPFFAAKIFVILAAAFFAQHVHYTPSSLSTPLHAFAAVLCYRLRRLLVDGWCLLARFGTLLLPCAAAAESPCHTWFHAVPSRNFAVSS